MLERARAGYTALVGEEHISTLHCINDLGNIYAEKEDCGKSENYYLTALEGRKKLGPKHIVSIFDTKLNLGILYTETEKLGAAENYLNEALDGFTEAAKSDGSIRTQLGDTLHSLGSLYDRRENNELSVIKYEKALQLREEELGANHVDTIKTTYNLAIALEDSGQLQAVICHCKDAIDGYDQLYGEDHERTVEARDNCFKCMRRYMEEKSKAR